MIIVSYASIHYRCEKRRTCYQPCQVVMLHYKHLIVLLVEVQITESQRYINETVTSRQKRRQLNMYQHSPVVKTCRQQQNTISTSNRTTILKQVDSILSKCFMRYNCLTSSKGQQSSIFYSSSYSNSLSSSFAPKPSKGGLDNALINRSATNGRRGVGKL